ncbi:MAG: amino acid adenylation domain-containing protein, partial [Acidobacteriota bacterium]
MKPFSRKSLSARRLARLDALLAEEGLAPELSEIPRRPAGEAPPLSVGEEQLWFLAQLTPEDPSYNMPFVLRLCGALDPAALRAGLAALAARHESLRTVYPEVEGRPWKAELAGPLALPLVDLSGLSLPGAEREAARLAAEEGGRPFDLARGPLVRALLLAMTPGDHRLLLNLHHILADGASMAVLFRELPALYRGAVLPEPALQYGDFAHWQRGWLTGGEAADLRAWWRGRLSGLVPQEMAADRPAATVASSRGAFVPVAVGAGPMAALRRLGQDEGATLFMVLLAAFQTLLHRRSGQDDVAVGSPVSGRDRAELQELVGFLVNMVVLRTDLGGDPSFRALLGRARETALGAFSHGELPFEILVEELHPERRLSRNPLFRAAFVLQPPAAAVEEGGLAWEMSEVPTGTAKFDLELELREGSDGLAGRLWYACDLFDAPTVERMAGHLGELLEGILEDPDRRLSDLPLLTAAEQRQIAQWAGTRTAYPRERGIHELFAEQAARRPEATALVFGEERISYRELDEWTDRIARRLAALGIGAESRVGLFAERSPEMVAGTLGILKAGAAYVPLDVQYPRERLEWMLEDADLSAVLTQGRLAGLVPASAPFLLLDGTLGEEPTEEIRPWAGPDSAAYLMYTSGSTGRPKGVVATHRNVVRLVRETDFAGFGETEVFLQFAPVSFDAATLEIWGPLLNGGTLVVCDPHALSFHELGRVIERERVTTLWLTAGLFHQMVDESLESLAGVRQLLAGGDVLSPAHVARALAALPGCRLINGYGPTENTTFTCCHTVEEGAGEAIPVGRPIANTWVHVLDRSLRPVPVGLPGELCAGGDGLARGYFRRPGVTAERFVPDPLSAEPGARLYRTGDLVHRRPDGVVEFLGRIDNQVKIRGFRVEPGEVEQALGLHPEVASCAVSVREDRPGDKRLVAYVVSAGAPADADLRSFLERTLPPPMIPSAFVRLESLPLTPNGKVDRRALPAPEDAQGAERERVGPRTPTEEVLAGIWGDVLGLELVDVRDDFFALGGHSLGMMRVASRIRDAFGVELPLRALFEASTLESLAERVEQEQGAAVLPPLLRYPREGALPLSFAQSRLWFLDQLEPGQATYNIPLALDLHGPLDTPALERALHALVERQESLRTTFPWLDGRPVQVVGAPALEGLPKADLSGLPEVDRLAVMAALESAAAREPFDLARGPLWRALLVRRSESEHTLVLVLHHIIADGWSLGVLFRDLGGAYAGAAAADLPVQYADFALWQREWLRGEALERQLAFWRPRLEGLPALELATDHPRPSVPARRGAECSRALSQDLLASLRSFSGRRGATLFMTLIASLQALLYRYTGQRDFAIGSAVANRGASELEGLIGFFANTLVLRGAVSGSLPFRELLAAARDAALGAYGHQDAPFELLVEALQPERDLHHAPLFQVMLNLEGERDPLRLAGLDTAVRVLGTGTAKFDLGFSLLEGDEPAAGVEFPVELFEAATIERMLGHWLNLLQGVTEEPEAAVESLPLHTLEERQQLLDWNATGREYAGEACLHELVEAQVSRTPGAVALVFEGEELTYRELDDRAERLADRLRELGAGTDELVGICAERSLEMVVGLLGILKAGAAYVPIDPGYPAERLAYMLADSAVSVLLTQARLAARLPEHGARVVLLDVLDGPSPVRPAARRASAIPDSLAYMIYTSGSTGRPKGAMNSHRAARNRLLWMQEAFGLGPGDRVLQKTPFSFDVSVWEFFWPLMTGARLVIAKPGGHQDPGYLADLIGREGITTLHFVPPMLRAFLETADLERCGSLRRVICSGEALPADLESLFFSRLDAELHNLYGPTEAAVDVTWWRCERGSRAASVPIGRPIANTTIHLLDRDLRSVPLGVPGELFIGGVQPARGYRGRPELTAEKFVPDPFGEPGSRLYRTGDLCRWRPDGAVDYLGRIDQQVKIRGFRIELEEIETALREHPAVRQSALAVHRRGGDPALVAYVVSSDGTPFAPDALRLFLQDRLPDYMVPEFYVPLAELPLSPNGKVDRKALPAPGAPERAGDGGEPRTPVEEILAAIWAEVLGLDRVGIRDHFFALGGHSLKATQVVSRIRAGFRVDLPLRLLFEAPVLADFAARIEPLLREASDVPVPVPVPVPADRGRPLPLSFPQQRLWFLDRLRPGDPAYNVPALVIWEGDLDPATLERSLRAMLARHESLRTTFGEIDGDPVQVIGPVPDLRLPVADLRGLPKDRREAEMGERATRLGQEPFDLVRGPLVRFLLFQLDDREHGLLTVFHHIIADWWSLGVFLRELGELYQGGEPEPPALQYADFAVWQREWLQGESLEAQLAFWRERLAGVPPLELPTDRPRPAVRRFRGESRPFTLPAALSARVESVARAEGVTRFMVYLAAFEALLQRYSGQSDFAVGMPIANRNQPWTEGLIGFFVNTLALRSDLAGSPSFRELLRRVRATALGAYAHQDMPFERLVDVLAPQRDLSHAPLFQVLLTFQNEVPRHDLPGASLRVEGLPLGRTKFDLTLALGERPLGVEGYLDHDSDLFGPVTAGRLVAHFQRLLEEALSEPDRVVEELPLLGETERHQILVEWNAGRGQEPTLCVHEQFAEQAARRPQDPALVCEEIRWTYGELEARANRLAWHLQALGVGPESRVGLCLERSAEAILALLAVLKAGGAYVPLDPAYPPERLAGLVRDAGVAAVVTLERFLPRLPGSADPATVCLDRDAAAIATRPARTPAGGAGLDHLAYVLFTSGSTGRPKGVANGHRQFARYVDRILARLDLPGGSSFAMISSLSGDVIQTALFPALCTGGCLHVISEQRGRDPVLLAEYMRRERVDFLKIVPSHLAALLSGPDPAGVLPQRLLVLGGEAFSWELKEEVRALSPGLRIQNHYGPAETTVAILTWTVGERVAGASVVPLGKPIPGSRVYLLDRNLDPLPPGVPGELWVGGPSLSRGYLGRPDLTAERFLPDPFAETPGSRLYRTGDRARLLPDGCMEFLGRIDFQVKIRGFRVEPGEIEAVLKRCAGVREAVVMARDGMSGSRELVAWVVGERSLDAAGLREALRNELPAHMIPAAFLFLDALPLNANGKIDRHALPSPERARVDRMPEESADDLRRRIADLWQEVLGVERVGLHDNFFDLGGHSLLLVRVQGRMRRDLGLEVPVVDLFRFPTVSALAAHLGGTAAVTAVTAVAAALAPVGAALSGTGRQDIAVIGLSGRFPGAGSADELWDNLCRGIESITFFGEPADGDAPGQRHVPARGVLADVGLFDAAFFGIRPREAELLDPQQRLFLECSWEALESAGYDPARYPGAIGVWAGVGRSWYYLRHIHGGPGMDDPESHFGNDKDFMPTRVSYKLGLRGPSLAVQTSCSSSLVAVHLACRSLAAGECDMALAGGARIYVPQDQGYVYEEGSIASPDGHCRAFDAEAGGVVPGNGVGAVLLKRLDDALADGDTVLAVVKGSAVNNDGWDKVGYTAPSVEGQARAIAAAHAAAGVTADSISYVEAHGTGTALGDPIEVAALKQAFAGVEGRGSCAIGSIKTNIGHLDAAAGVAGLMKLVLSLRHGLLPPSLHFKRPNPGLGLEDSPFRVNDTLRPWTAPGPRRGGVSSFGIGGTNAHVVVEEPPVQEPSAPSRPWQLLTVSARTEAALRRAGSGLADHLERSPDLDLPDAAYTLHV